ncbi:MAG TPA: hypothetical protein VLZ72_02540 [Flavobacterium sp.]|nr:hypothetical protein [Flavobacterium sp.]
MFTLVVLSFLAVIFSVVAYFIKYKKKYNLIAGYTNFDKNNIEKIRPKASIIADCTFLFSFLLIVFSIINLFTDWFKIITPDLDGMFILFVSLILTLFFYILLRIRNLKKQK